MVESLVSLLVTGGRGGGEAGFSGIAGVASLGGVSWSGRIGRVFVRVRGVPSVEFASVSGSCVAEEELGRVDSVALGVTCELWFDSISSSSRSIDEGIRGRDFKGTDCSTPPWNICSWI